MADVNLAQELTLSVVSHGHGVLLHRLLDDLAKLISLRGARVIITLNLPEKLDIARWSALEIIVLSNDLPKGFGANHNAAFRHCKTRWYGVLNPDLMLPRDIFPELVNAAKSQPRVGVVAPVITNSNGGLEDSVRKNITPLSLLQRTLQRIAGKRQTLVLASGNKNSQFFWLAGMFLVFDSAAYRTISGFDERFFLYCEDYDICVRLLRAGYQLRQVQSALSVHDAQRDSQKSIKHLRWHLASLLRVWTSSVFWWTLMKKRNCHLRKS